MTTSEASMINGEHQGERQSTGGQFGETGYNVVFLTAPKDLQQGAAYETALGRLISEHGAENVMADRDLFEGTKDWNARWKQVYGGAGRLYVLVREDGTIGLGVWKQAKWLVNRGVPALAILEHSPEVAHGEFGLQRLQRQNETGGEDLIRFARVTAAAEAAEAEVA